MFDALVLVKRLKWAEHITRMKDDRWTKLITEWYAVSRIPVTCELEDKTTSHVEWRNHKLCATDKNGTVFTFYKIVIVFCFYKIEAVDPSLNVIFFKSVSYNSNFIVLTRVFLNALFIVNTERKTKHVDNRILLTNFAQQTIVNRVTKLHIVIIPGESGNNWRWTYVNNGRSETWWK